MKRKQTRETSTLDDDDAIGEEGAKGRAGVNRISHGGRSVQALRRNQGGEEAKDRVVAPVDDDFLVRLHWRRSTRRGRRGWYREPSEH